MKEQNDINLKLNSIKESYYFKKYRNEIATQAASLSILPVWFPAYKRSLAQRSNLLLSTAVNDLSHTKLDRKDWYRGISANLFMQILFPYCDWMLGQLPKLLDRNPNFQEKIAWGFLTGSTTVLLANPYEATVLASQAQAIPPSQAFYRIVRTSGIKGLYTGSLPMCFRNGFFISSIFVSSQEIKNRISNLFTPTKVNYFFAAATAGSLSALLYTGAVVPFDIAAVMRQADHKQSNYLSARDAVGRAYKKHGIKALKAGTSMRILASSIEMTGFNIFYDFYKQKCSTLKNEPSKKHSIKL